MDWRMDDWSLSSRVSPFRYLRIIGYLLLPEAFRSLSRLSSALSAKASTLRSFLLDLVLRYIALYLRACHLSMTFCLLSQTFGFFSVWCLVNNRYSIIYHLFCVKFSRYILLISQQMEMERFELLTPCLQGRCSPNWATPPFFLWRTLHKKWA